MNALAKKKQDVPEGYAILNVAHKTINVPATTLRRHIDNGDIELYLINDEVVIKLEEAISVLTSPDKTRRKTRMRVMAGLKDSGITIESLNPKTDLFA